RPPWPGAELVTSDGGAGSDPERLLLRRHLLAVLLDLPFPAFLDTIGQLLAAMGYVHVRRLGREHWRGKSLSGGLDIEATAQSGVTRGRVLIQVKRYQRPVHRRFVDELRGTMVRTGARHGLLIATTTFAMAARRAIGR